jgi:hypothetical protein
VLVCAYPGSFNPPTIAHLAIAEATLDRGFDRVELILSHQALGKAPVERPSFEQRLLLLRQIAANRDGLSVAVTDQQLLADIADGYDGLVMGEDKFVQILEPSWYASPGARDEAIGRLPRLLVIRRASQPDPSCGPSTGGDGEPVILPDHELVTLPYELAQVSSTGARGGRIEWMAPEARSFQQRTGAWSAG